LGVEGDSLNVGISVIWSSVDKWKFVAGRRDRKE
jgi:hypothetical protein